METKGKLRPHPATLTLLTVASAWSVLVGTSEAAAADTVSECIAAHEHSLELRDQGKIVDARGQLAVCAASRCPAPIQQACRNRIAELNAAIPSVVFDVKDGVGRDVEDVKLSIDGAPAAPLAATAIQLDPGRHVFHLEAAGHRPVERVLVLHEGEQDKHEALVLQPTERDTRIPERKAGVWRTVGLVSLGAGVLGLGTAGVLGLVAKSSYDGAQGCSGTICTTHPGLETSNSARDLGTVATVVFVAGAAVAAGGAVLWLAAPKDKQPGEPPHASWSVGVTPGGTVLRARF
jgi:hypothetical protein